MPAFPLDNIQVDNQLVVTPFPALLYPIAEALPPRYTAAHLSDLPPLPPLAMGRGERDHKVYITSVQDCRRVIYVLASDLGGRLRRVLGLSRYNKLPSIADHGLRTGAAMPAG